MRNFIYLSLLCGLFFLSCSNDQDDNIIINQNDLESLPIDTGGVQTAKVIGSTNAIYGHYIYTPSDYNNASPNYPLLVFLHGSGQVGNSQTNPDVLTNLIYTGPPSMIEQKKWSPTYPMIVASPQLTSGSWNADDVHSFINYLISTYNINTDRIYLTGYSLGAYGCYSYISKYGADSYARAIVPIAGGGDVNSGNKYTTTAVWAFHGGSDNAVPTSRSIDMVSAINASNPNTKAKVTIYPGVGHDSDTRTFDGTGMNSESIDYDAFNMDIYDWMFLYKK
ncbi:dienelactone hydrolase family protein [Mariniflexile gromovii]|uniref:Dienelactone hydrolase family protein n=1 Tax=Mariniflexile gromovii TaxID=362523 RepID=A0ABS4BRA1_9FLAO|nr:dienelactone hydrolase family protein [Mariniflexile gromovii]MBP0903113.1 dienelactone hydrolase family protein [Mariniflexile gromovii]